MGSRTGNTIGDILALLLGPLIWLVSKLIGKK